MPEKARERMIKRGIDPDKVQVMLRRRQAQSTRIQDHSLRRILQM